MFKRLKLLHAPQAAESTEALLELYLSPYSEQTKQRKRGVLMRFLKRCGHSLDTIQHMTESDVLKWVMHAQQQLVWNSRTQSAEPIVPQTICATLREVRRVWEYYISCDVVERQIVSGSIIQRFAGRRSERRPTNPLPYQKVTEMLEACNRYSLRGRRDAAILAVLFGTGMRRSELVSLQLWQVQIAGDVTLIRSVATKGGRDQTKVLPAWAGEILLEYCEERRLTARESDPIFCAFDPDGRAKGAITASGLRRIFQKYLERVGLSTNDYSLHSARCTVINLLLDQGVSHKDVTRVSGHRSVVSVEHYERRRQDEDGTIAGLVDFKMRFGKKKGDS